MMLIFFFNDTAATEFYTYLHTLSLPDALPISSADSNRRGSSASTLSRLDNIEDWRSAAFRRSGRLPISPPRSGKCLASKRLGDILRLEPFRIPTSPRTLGSKRPIGRASCRDRVCQSVKISGVAGTIKKKQKTTQ